MKTSNKMSQVEQEKFKRKINALNRYAVLQLEEATILNVGLTPGDKNTMHIGMVTEDDLFAKGVLIRITIKKGSHAADIVRALVDSADLIRNASERAVEEKGGGPNGFLNRVFKWAAALFLLPGILLDRIVKNIKKEE